jgi:hypothetical protein
MVLAVVYSGDNGKLWGQGASRNRRCRPLCCSATGVVFWEAVMAAMKRKRDMACQPGSSGGSARLLFFFNTHCVGANGFAECLRRSSGGCYAHAFFLRRLCRGLSFSGCAGLLQGGGVGFFRRLCSLLRFKV